MQYTEIDEEDPYDTLRSRLMYLRTLPMPYGIPEPEDERFEVVENLRSEYVALAEKLFKDHRDLTKKIEKTERLLQLVDTFRDESYHADMEQLVAQFEDAERIEELKASVNEQLVRLRKFQRILNICSDESFMCFVCMERNVEYFMDPCGHMVCGMCLDRIHQSCPFCRTDVRLKKVFTG